MRIVLPPRIDPNAVASGDPAAVVTLGGETMGTMWRLLYATRDVPGAQRLGEAVQARLDDLVAQMSHWARLGAGALQPLHTGQLERVAARFRGGDGHGFAYRRLE